MHHRIASVCEQQGSEYFRFIPFATTWNYFFESVKKHFFLFADRKTAIVYWYDRETSKFVGPLYDSGPRFKENDCIKRYSLYNKEATVVNSEGTFIYMKKTNKHQFPICPLNVVHDRNIHSYPGLYGWAYEQDPDEIELKLLSSQVQNIYRGRDEEMKAEEDLKE